MRASGAIKAAKKAGNVAAEGAIAVKTDGKAAVLLEVNSQTDFLALQDDFKNFVAESLEEAFAQKLTDAAPWLPRVKQLVKPWSPSAARTSTSVAWCALRVTLSVPTCTATRSALPLF